MTPRKELFIKIKEALMTISEIELVDLDRKQMQSDKFPELFVAALIKINKISWESMTEGNQEGTTTVDVTLYCRDGWMDQHQGTTDPESGLMEIDLLDDIAESIQFLNGIQFKPLEQSEDETEEQGMEGIFSYRQTFKTTIYRKLKSQYQPQKIGFK